MMVSVHAGFRLRGAPGLGLGSDRIGGLQSVLAGNVAQVIGMSLFLVTQDEAGLFVVAAIYGMGFSGIIPSWMLAVRQLSPRRRPPGGCPRAVPRADRHGVRCLAGRVAVRPVRQLRGGVGDRDRREHRPGGAGRSAAAAAPAGPAAGAQRRGRLDAWRQTRLAEAGAPRLPAVVRRSPASAQGGSRQPRVKARRSARRRRWAGRRAAAITA